MSGESPPRKNRKEERDRRLGEQLRENLRKRKELSRARKSATGGPVGGTLTDDAQKGE